jgi:radical SAM superfamily enzyme YgiQ (UPF0313 family)
MAGLKIGLVLSTNASYRRAVVRGRPYSSWAPATLAVLAALVPTELKAEVRTFDLVRQRIPDDLHHCDLVGISTITCGAPFAYQLADSLRSRGVTAVLGGPHPTVLPEEALAHADAVVVGYGEKTWPLLLRDFTAGRLQPLYRDFENPFAFSVRFMDRSQFKGKGYFFDRVVEFSRGCPNSCSFCSVAGMNHGRVHFRDRRDVMQELKALGRSILFLDSNFTENPDQARPLWEDLRNTHVRWYCAASLRFASDPDLVGLAAACGCRGVLIGFESINEASIRSSLKSFNRPREYSEAIARLHRHGIFVLGCFVFGLDGDEADVFERTVDFVRRAKIDLVRYAVATPFPGTPLHERLKREGRLISRNWEEYDTEHVVFQPLRMTPEQLFEGHRWAYRETYRLSGVLGRIRTRSLVLSLMANLGFRRLAFSFDSLQGELE